MKIKQENLPGRNPTLTQLKKKKFLLFLVPMPSDHGSWPGLAWEHLENMRLILLPSPHRLKLE